MHQFASVSRLDQEVDRTGLDRFDGAANITMSAQEDDGQRQPIARERLLRLQAVY